MNRYKIALKKDADAPKLDPELERRLRYGASARMADRTKSVVTSGSMAMPVYTGYTAIQNPEQDGDFCRGGLERKVELAHFIARKLFPKSESEDCIKTSAGFMHIEEEPLNRIIQYIEAGK